MIKKIIKAVNSVFGNFVRVQSRLSFDEARTYLLDAYHQSLYILLSQHITQKNI